LLTLSRVEQLGSTADWRFFGDTTLELENHTAAIT
jgi:hypothetical protein